VRSFLLQTAILDRLCVPLCNAVTEREDGKEMLDVLERSNLFLIPLDDQRQWYRYHHLFADVLQTHLMEAQPDQVSTCIGGRARGMSRTVCEPMPSAMRWLLKTSSAQQA
jgi:ATP/maltotriose-dependent transcriptional regulator MalT